MRLEWLETGEGLSQPELGTYLFPAEDLRREWGVDLAALPDEWPAPLKDFVAAALSFGLFPSVVDPANMLDRAKKLGSRVPLPRERQQTPLELDTAEDSLRRFFADFHRWKS